MQIETRIHDLEGKIKKGQVDAETNKTKWLNEVNQMIDQINEKFVDLFNTMGCKGEICLDLPESPVNALWIFSLEVHVAVVIPFQQDFEKYGVNIKVQFRDGEKLHEMVRCVDRETLRQRSFLFRVNFYKVEEKKVFQ